MIHFFPFNCFPPRVLRLNNNEPPLTYSRFQEIVSIIGPPEHPVAPVTAQDVEGVDMAIASDHYEKYGIPSLEELGKSLGKIWEGFSPDIGLVQWAVLIQLSIELL